MPAVWHRQGDQTDQPHSVALMGRSIYRSVPVGSWHGLNPPAGSHAGCTAANPRVPASLGTVLLAEEAEDGVLARGNLDYGTTLHAKIMGSQHECVPSTPSPRNEYVESGVQN